VLETQPRSTVRTIVASFLFTDLVGFSKGTAADQFAAKANLSAVLRRHLGALKESDYWIKDTGDGALIAFVSNPEHALYMALALGHDYGAPGGDGGAASARLRTGLHLGTVKESIDVEARRNFIGDGINAAKRIMDFALPGQIAASRSFFEAIANLDAAYAALFQHLGAPDDKHGRAHELYALAPSDSVLEKLRGDIAAEAGEVVTASGTSQATVAANAAQDSPAVTRRRWLPVVAGIGAIAVAAWFIATRTHEPSPPSNQPPKDAAPAATVAAPSGKDNAASKDAESSAVKAAPPERAAPTGASVAPPPVPTLAAPSPQTAPRSPEASSATTPSAQAARPPTLAPSAARMPPEKPKAAAASPGAEGTASGPTSPRCSRILQKAAVGEPLTSDEQRELANTCR
jgi:hypothetical protein